MILQEQRDDSSKSMTWWNPDRNFNPSESAGATLRIVSGKQEVDVGKQRWKLKDSNQDQWRL